MTENISMPENSPKRLRRDAAAAYTGVSAKTLANWASSGRYGLRYRKMGKWTDYLVSDLDALMEAHTGTKAEQIKRAKGDA